MEEKRKVLLQTKQEHEPERSSSDSMSAIIFSRNSEDEKTPSYIYIETQFLHSEFTRTRLERDDEFASWKI